MQYFLLFVLISAVVQVSVAPPVNQKGKDGEHDNENEVEYADIVMEYRRYLTEVLQVLESDPDFREKLVKADEADIRTGKIAEQLQFVNHNVRSMLDEVKRAELERLRRLATKENELKNGLAEHLDHTNTRTFEIQDLKKLIAKTTMDLAEADRTRRGEFKQHEMEKKYKEEEKLRKMSPEERKKYEEELQALKEKQKKHEPVHHPGSKQQLEEVWEKQDHMESEDFNPRTFFYLHDIDGNGVWDQDEVKALFLKELDKLYAQGTPQDDLLKRAEEMERMREHVFNEADLNKDGLISYEEFLEQTKKPDFQRDEGWQGLDEQQIYTQEEFEKFERLQQLSAKGIYSADNTEYHQQQPQVMVPQQQYQPVSVQPIHGQIPQQQQYQQMHVQQQQIPVQQQQVHAQQQQIPVQQQGQIPFQQNQGAVPVQQNQGQVPVQQQQNAVNQVPRSIQNNVPQQNSPSQSNSQPVQGSAQQEINRNKI